MRKQASADLERRVNVSFEDFRFIVPQEDGREVLIAADRLSTTWSGSGRKSVGGTYVSFELITDGQVRSMDAKASFAGDYNNPAAFVAAEVHRLALAYGPVGEIPRRYDWHSFESEGGRFPCNNLGLNVPDPDGFGVGDDACARSLTDQPSR